MDFGICMEFENCQGNTQAESFRDSFALEEAADAWGLDGVWLAEMHFNPSRSVLSTPIVVASSIATRTKRLRVGVAVAAWTSRSCASTCRLTAKPGTKSAIPALAMPTCTSRYTPVSQGRSGRGTLRQRGVLFFPSSRDHPVGHRTPRPRPRQTTPRTGRAAGSLSYQQILSTKVASGTAAQLFPIEAEGRSGPV
jgi:hypothetical protein